MSQLFKTISRTSRTALNAPALRRADGGLKNSTSTTTTTTTPAVASESTANINDVADAPVRKAVYKDWLMYLAAGVGVFAGYHGTAKIVYGDEDQSSSSSKSGTNTNNHHNQSPPPPSPSSSPPMSPTDSAVEMLHIMEPAAANPHGNVHGGAVLRLIDEAGAICAARHARGLNVVTRQLDSMVFHAPMYIGEMAVLYATMTFVSARSMEVRVEVFAENLKTGERRHTNSALLTYVALNDAGKACPVPRLILNTPAQIREFSEGQNRYEARKAAAAAEKASMAGWKSLSHQEQYDIARAAASAAKQSGHSVSMN